MSRHTDADLVRRVLEGDREAYAGLVRRHQDGMYRYARAMGLDPDAARDEVQESLVKAYQDLARCQNPERFEMWVFRILRNRCLDHLKNVRRRSVPLDDVTLYDDRPDPDENLVRNEAARRLRAALESMGTDLRDAFLMKHYEDRTYDEMSELTGASVSAMKMRVLRAREALRDALGREIDASR